MILIHAREQEAVFAALMWLQSKHAKDMLVCGLVYMVKDHFAAI